MYQLKFPPAVTEGSVSSTPSSAFIFYRFFDDGHSDQCEVISHYNFNLDFSDSDVEHLFMCFWPSVCFLWRNVLLAPLPIFYWVVCSFVFCVVCKYFFPIHFVYDFFCYSKAFEFNYIPLFIFVFIFITLGEEPKRYFCNLYQTVFCSNS